MQEFWEIIRNWQPIGQFIFLLLVLGGTATLIRSIAYYIVIAIKGWPPEHFEQEDEDNDG